MKKFKIGLSLFTISMLLITCKKEHIQPSATNGNPVFYFNGTVNGSPVSLDAGVSNYYMYSSYTQSSGGLYSFIGNLQQVSSSKSSIQFIINDYRALSSGAQEINMATSLDTGNYNYYYVGGTPRDSAIFSPSVGTDTVKSYIYRFGDGNTLMGTGAPIICSHVYLHPGSNYNTSLAVLFTDGITDSSSGPLKLNTPATQITDSVTQIDSIGSTAVIHFYCTPHGGSGNYAYSWNFNDSANNTSTLQNPSHTYTNTAKTYHVSLQVNDISNNDSIVTNITPGTSSTISGHLVNYSIPHVYSVPNTLGLSNVTILYTDPSGQVYTTKDSIQHAGSDFQIVSVSNYQNNENNQTTKMLHVKFNCTLYNGSNSITIKNGDAVIAVAYK